jgi:hypothetical protein
MADDQNFSFVEFVSAEDAANALLLDGAPRPLYALSSFSFGLVCQLIPQQYMLGRQE